MCIAFCLVNGFDSIFIGVKEIFTLKFISKLLLVVNPFLSSLKILGIQRALNGCSFPIIAGITFVSFGNKCVNDPLMICGKYYSLVASKIMSK